MNIVDYAKPIAYEVSSSPHIVIKNTNAGGISKWFAVPKPDKDWVVLSLTKNGWKPHTVPIFLDTPEDVYLLLSTFTV